MDGYGVVKERSASQVEGNLRYNVGYLVRPMFDEKWRMLRRFFSCARLRVADNQTQLGPERWSDDRWIRELSIITKRRTELGQSTFHIRVGQLLSELRALPTSKNENVAWQMKKAFIDRRFMRPENIWEPLKEPSLEDDIKQVRPICALSGEAA